MARRFDPAVAWEHIDQLAARHRITVRPCSRRDKSTAHIATRQVWVPPQRGPVDYLTALHELGHICAAEARRLYRLHCEHETHALELALEATCWGWAVDHALPAMLRGMTQREWQSVSDMLSTYLHPKAGQRRR